MSTVYKAVLRPKDPKVALDLTAKWKARVERQRLSPQVASGLFNIILTAQPYTFIGIIWETQDITDPKTGQTIDKLAEGDSFVDYAELCRRAPGIEPGALLHIGHPAPPAPVEGT